MSSRLNYILAGLFVIGLGVALIAIVLWLRAGGPRGDFNLYTVYMTESVSGLSKDSSVTYRGVPVGRVRQIELDPENLERVRLLVEIRSEIAIKQDTVAMLETQGLTGLAHVNLTGGSRKSPELAQAPGAEYPVIESKPSLRGRLGDRLSKLSNNLLEASNRINRLLSDENQRLVTETLRNIKGATGKVAEGSDAVVAAADDFRGILQNVRAASGRLPRILDEFEQTTLKRMPQLLDHLDRSAAALENMANELAGAGKALRETVRASGRDLERFSGEALAEAGALVVELRQTAENLRRFSDQLNRNPDILIYGAPQPPPGPGE